MGLRPFIKVVISFVCPLSVRLLLSSIVVTFRTTWMGGCKGLNGAATVYYLVH